MKTILEYVSKLIEKGIVRIESKQEGERLDIYEKVLQCLRDMNHEGEALNLIECGKESVFILELDDIPFIRNHEKLIKSDKY